jgi:hypothetical protein
MASLERRAKTRARLRRRHFRKSRHVRFSQRTILPYKLQGDKLNRLQHQATFIKGGLAESVFFVTVIVAVVGGILNTNWDALIQTINAMAK